MVESAARVVPMEDEEFLEAAQRALSEAILPYMEESGAEGFLTLQLRYCINVLGMVRRNLKDRQAARSEADCAVQELFDSRPADSDWLSTSSLDTGRYLGLARQRGEHLQPDSLAAKLRKVLAERLDSELTTRAGR